MGATVLPKESNEVAAALSPGWDTDRDGPRPDVWVPDSSLWALVAASRKDAEGMLPPDMPSLASSPVIIAVRRPVAQALGWPQKDLGWQTVLGAFSRPDLWATLGHPEWAALRLGMSDPTVSTAGLASTLAFLDSDADGVLSDAELTAGVAFTQLLGSMAPDTTAFINEQTDPSSTIGAFPVLERDIAAYNATKPAVELVPAYPEQAPIVADFPYAVLGASWVNGVHRSAAEQFLQYLRGPEGQRAFAAAGFREPDQRVGDETQLPSDLGFRSSLAPPRRSPTSAAMSQLITDWTAIQRQSNILAVLDTSGSMNENVPGTPLTRLQLLQQTAVSGFSLLNQQSNIGLWQFSTDLTPKTDYRELVPYGPVLGNIGAVPRKQALIRAVQSMRADGGTGLYDTVYAAFRAIQKRWEPNDTNAILLITDGKDEDENSIGLATLLARLKKEARADRPTPVICIAVGPDADAGPLRQIAQLTGGRTFVVRDPKAAVQTLILAFAGRLR